MARLRSLRPFLPVFLTFLVLACSSDNGGDDLDDGNGGEGGQGGDLGTIGVSKTQKLGIEGGQVKTDAVTLTFPAGAVRKDTNVTVASLGTDDAKTLPATEGGIKPVGVPVKFTPHGLTFDEPVDVALEYTPPADEKTPLVAMKLDNDTDPTWEIVPSAKFESGEANFQITGFSYYCVFSDPNGVAEELYPADDVGSGGSGSGGEGSGGEGSGGEGDGGAPNGGTSGGGSPGGGGAPSGGAPSGGGSGGEVAVGGQPSGGVGGDGGQSGGGTGGVGGSGGGSSASPGYLRTPTIHGYGFMGYGSGASITSDLSTTPGPNCAYGTTSTAPTSSAYLGYKLNQLEFPFQTQPNPPTLMAHEGLWIYIAWNSLERPMQVELVDDTIGGAKWCATVMDSENLEFIPWENFNTDCVEAEGMAFDPATDHANKVFFTLPSTLVDQGFDFCIDELSTGNSVYAPPGYLNGPEWFGSGFTVSDPSSTVTSTDLTTALAPNCASGLTGDNDGYAGLHYYVDQPLQTLPGSIELTGEGIKVGVSWDGSRQLHVQLTSEYLATTWCAPMPSPGVHFIPYASFTTSCDGQGSPFPLDTEIDSVGVVAPGVDYPDAGFNFCITELGPDTGPVGPPPGYLNGPDWHGHGFEVTDGLSPVASDLTTQVFPNCANGSTNASPSAFAGIHYNVNQPVEGTNSVIYLQGQGVHVNLFNWDEARPLYAQIRSLTAGTTWCAPIPAPGPQLIPLENFNTECVGNTGTSLPGELLIDSVGIVALSTGVADDVFAFCVGDLRPDLGGGPMPSGYLLNPEIHGYGFEQVNAGATVTTDLLDYPAPNCATGETSSDPTSYAALMYAANESPVGGDNTALTWTQNGIWVDFSSPDARQYMVKVDDSAWPRSWCAILPSNGPSFVPWYDFSDDCFDLQNGAAPVLGVDTFDAIGVVAMSTDQQEPFDFCIQNVQPMPNAPQPNGYLQNPAWHGYGYEEVNGDATLSTSLLNAPMPACASGTTGVDVSSAAAILFAVNQTDYSGVNTPVLVSDLGVYVDFQASFTERAYVVRVHDSMQPRDWCAPLPGSGAAFVPWDNFSDNCADPPAGSPPIPGVDQIDYVGIHVPSTGNADDPYGFCVWNLEPMAAAPIPNGYLNGPTWFGYGAAFSGGVSGFSDNIGIAPAPNCISGTMDSQLSSWASLSYRINESVAGNDNQAIPLQGDGITIGINTAYESDLRVNVFSGAEAKTYCAVLPPSSGTFDVLWSDFNDTCWTTGGNVFNPGATDIDEIGISVISEGLASDPFGVCVTGMEEYIYNP